MIEVAEAIKSFLPTEQQAVFPVSPLEEPVFILTSGQLQELISQAIAQALEKREEALPEAQIGQGKLLEIIKAQAQEMKALQVKLEAQAEKLETLEKLEELYHGKPPALEERPILREVYQRRERSPDQPPLQSLEHGGRSPEPGAGGSIPQRERGREASGPGRKKDRGQDKGSEEDSQKNWRLADLPGAGEKPGPESPTVYLSYFSS